MVTLEKVNRASKILRQKVYRTPLTPSPTLSQVFKGEIYLKLENLQRTGSFKIRGAMYKILIQLENIENGGVVAASAGNHAQGVALAAREAHIPSTIVMPEWASISKQEATRGYGGNVVISGANIEDSLEKAKQIALSGKTLIHPFDDPDIIIGQGTIAQEIFEELKDPDMLIVPIGGGGLISGIAAAAKAIKPDVQIIGVEAAACPSAFTSCKEGRITNVQADPSLADGIAVKQIGELNFDLIRKYVDDIVLVEEEQIASAMLTLIERKKIVAEGAGAAALAALMSGAVRVFKDRKAVLVVSGGNIDSPLLGRIINRGLVKNGRLMRFQATISDTPGSLARLLDIIARIKANVLHISHDRNVRDLPMNLTRVELELETRSQEHIEEIETKLKECGYQID